jgi:hypothetical protein
MGHAPSPETVLDFNFKGDAGQFTQLGGFLAMVCGRRWLEARCVAAQICNKDSHGARAMHQQSVRAIACAIDSASNVSAGKVR